MSKSGARPLDVVAEQDVDALANPGANVTELLDALRGHGEALAGGHARGGGISGLESILLRSGGGHTSS